MRHMTLALVEHRTYLLSNSFEHGLQVMIGEALLLKQKRTTMVTPTRMEIKKKTERKN